MTMSFFDHQSFDKARYLTALGPFAVASSLCVFACLLGLSMEAYPGGTAWDATTRGHDFWRNYLCDLERQIALNGVPNASGARLAQAAMLSLASGAAPFWFTMARLLVHAPLRVPVRMLGCVSSLAVMGVAILPSDRFPSLHPVLLALGGIAGLLAASCGVLGLMRRERGAALVGGGTFIVSAVDLALYGWSLRTGGSAPVMVAVLERVALLLALAWMLLVAWRSIARRNHG